jgi:pimeloyl-ACP methyl ester carboxylesterase
MIEALDAAVLPPAVQAGFVSGVNGLRMHVLEAGRGNATRVLLLHGFPELSYSWRRVLPALAAAGCHVVAPDLRGFGRTTGWDAAYATELAAFGILNQLRDMLALVAALGWRQVAMVVGHDSGASLAAACALVRPDLFGSVVLMSAPFAGPPAFAFDTRAAPPAPTPAPAPAPALDMAAALAALQPARKHYHDYFSTPAAAADLQDCPQGLQDFLRAYYHFKSADWAGNQPQPLPDWSAQSLARLPTYYVMRQAETMPQTVAAEMPSAAQVAACRWLTEAELAVYTGEYARTGFQGGLNWYRCGTSGLHAREWSTFAGRRIDIPAGFIAGRQDWGVFQRPGAFERMQAAVCARLEFCHLVDHAGHWVQQEQPDQVNQLLTGFLRHLAGAAHERMIAPG